MNRGFIAVNAKILAVHFEICPNMRQSLVDWRSVTLHVNTLTMMWPSVKCCDKILAVCGPNFFSPNWRRTWRYLPLSAQRISSIAQIIKSVCVSVSEWVSLSHKTSWTLYRSQSSTDLYQNCHQDRVPGCVVTCCFWWKSKIFLSAKPEMELILIIAPMEKYL